MNCNQCGAPLSGEETVCPVCGHPVEQIEKEPADQAFAEAKPEESENTPEQAFTQASSGDGADVTDWASTQEDKKPSGKGSTLAIAAIIVLLAIIAVLVVLLIKARKVPAETEQAPTTEQGVTEEETPEETPEGEALEEEAQEEEAQEEETFVPTVSYIKEADAFDDALLDQVIVSCGDSTLTNRKLAYYYWQEFYSFVNMYSSYITLFMNPAARLDTQAYTEEESWDQFFMETAVTTYRTCASAANAAREEGYALGEKDQENLDGLAERIGSLAEQNGYASADEYLAKNFGPYCTMETYQEFMDEYILGASYLNAKLEAEEITDEDLENYYEENKESYDAQGLQKDDTPMVNVRHILIQPEAVDLEEGDEGYEEAVQAAEEAAKARAEEIYQEWQEGDGTEESFAALASENSADSSAASGGLIENVAPGKTVEGFDDWCFEEGRKPGDTGIVETEYGYHILYYVSQCSESYWHSVVYSDYESACYARICEDLRALYPGEPVLSKAAVYPCNTEM